MTWDKNKKNNPSWKSSPVTIESAQDVALDMEKDIEVIMDQSGVTKMMATAVYFKNNGDIVNTIMELQIDQ